MVKRTGRADWSVHVFNHRGDYQNTYPQKLACACPDRPTLWNLAGGDTTLVCHKCGHGR